MEDSQAIAFFPTLDLGRAIALLKSKLYSRFI